MSSWRQQALIEAPVESVWSLLEDPSRFAEWNDAVAVTGAPTRIEKGTELRLRGRGPFGIPATTTFRVEELDEMREIKLRCQRSGFYSHWLLTDARGDTFAELEMGVEPVPGIEGKALAAIHTKRFLRTAAERTLDGLRRVAGQRGETARPE